MPKRSSRASHRTCRRERRRPCHKTCQTRCGHYAHRPRDRLDGGAATTRHIVRLSAIGKLEQLPAGTGSGCVQ
jgi:hypothetical protein